MTTETLFKLLMSILALIGICYYIIQLFNQYWFNIYELIFYIIIFSFITGAVGYGLGLTKDDGIRIIAYKKDEKVE